MNSMPIAIFDPTTYLQHLDPEITYSTTFLTGGVVNITARAVKTQHDLDAGKFPGHASIILKYAPPYVAGEGEKAPLTQYRQTIEALALSSFLDSRDSSSLHEILNLSGVAVPTLLYHDTEAFVLVLSDLGALPNLSDVFSTLGGQTLGSASATPVTKHNFFASDAEHLAPIQRRYFEDIGNRLGNFFAHLHSPATHSRILKKHNHSELQVPEIHDAVLELAIKPVANQIKLFPDLASIEEADLLGNRLVQDFTRQTLDNETSFVLGDSWTGAVLVSPLKLLSSSPTETFANSTPSTVAVIDWEFASLARGPHGDISQFLAHLELLRISAQQSMTFCKHEEALNILVDGLSSSYSRVTGEVNAEHVEIYQDKRHESSPPDPSSLKARKMRSAFLSHGAEMINVAFWKHWTCVTPTCVRDEDGKHTTVQHQCVLVRRMVERGLWFLRHACEDVDGFCGEQNWDEITADAIRVGRWVGVYCWTFSETFGYT